MDQGNKSQAQGRYGQKLFEAKSAEPHPSLLIVTHRPEDDQNGWDVLVEITPPAQADFPPDMQRSLIASYVQIKTTNDGRASAKISLANALKHAETSNPVFIAMFHGINIEGQDPVFYLRHVWKEEIEAWLRKARQAQGLSRKDFLRKTVTVKFDKSDVVASHPAEKMFQIIKEHGLGDYEKEKTKLFRELGYENGDKVLEFEIDGDKTIQELAKTQIGIGKAISLKDLHVYDVRFGIRTRNPINSLTDIKLEVIGETEPATLALSSSEGECIEVDGQLVASTILSADDPNFMVRFDFGVIEFIFHRSRKIELKDSYDPNGKYSLRQHRLAATLRKWMFEGNVSAKLSSNKCSLAVSLKKDIGSAPEEIWLDSLQIICQILGDNRLDSPSFTAINLYNEIVKKSLSLQLISANKIRLKLGFPNKLDGIHAIRGYVALAIDKWALAAIFSLNVLHQRSDDGFYYLEKARMIHRYAREAPLPTMVSDVRRDVVARLAPENRRFLVLEEGDLEGLIRKANANLPIVGKLFGPD